eukprot:scaffold7012_cov166-Ochromonas_danica.AAC.10
MEQKVVLVRDGKAQQMLARLLVPGDVILLTGGDMVAADVDWIEGDVLSVDTAALTGESMPRKYPSDTFGKRILGGMTILAGEAYALVRRTGSNTEIGKTQEAVMQDKSQKKISVFESKILLTVKIVISLSLIDVFVIFILRGVRENLFTPAGIRPLLLTILSIMVASVPVALPLVLQVTMALGAGYMAREYNAIVTSLPALQDISSMTILCSDKTGTLTSARLSILRDSVSLQSGYHLNDLLLYLRLASNPDKEDDPIDRACLIFFEMKAPPEVKSNIPEYHIKRTVGFTSTYKRTLWVYTHPRWGEVRIAKGLPNKVIDTSDGGEDDAEDQWRVQNHESVMKEVMTTTQSFSERGYKSLGVSVKVGSEPFQFVGMIPILDPPRHDTARTISCLRNAGVSVKMVTGDQLNIGKETARLIGLKQDRFYHGLEIRDESDRDQKIYEADGFAEVLPQDKRQIVLSLRERYRSVVGMTGDGVNDVSALSAAQCGIAVDGATDAAKNAASIILTTPGLSPVYHALIESRRIFRKLRAYVIYRLAATIQIVMSLSLLIYIAGCAVRPLLVVLLALFNDLTMMPIAYDNQKASAQPDNPDVIKILSLATLLGIFQAAITMFWAFFAHKTGFFHDDFNIFNCSAQAQSAVWLQLALSTEFLIFSTRASSFLWNSYFPHYSLIIAVFLGCIVLSVFAGTIRVFGELYVTDILIVWFFSFLVLGVVDVIKVVGLIILGEHHVTDLKDPGDLEEKEELQEPEGKEAEKGEEEEAKEAQTRPRPRADVEMGDRSRASSMESMEDQLLRYIQLSSKLRNFNRWLVRERSSSPENIDGGVIGEQNRRALSDTIKMRAEMQDEAKGNVVARRLVTAPASLRRQYAPPTDIQKRYSVSMNPMSTVVAPPENVGENSWLELSRSISGLHIRPHTPALLAPLLTDKHRMQLRQGERK